MAKKPPTPDDIEVEPDLDETWKLNYDGEHIADVLWEPDEKRSQGKPSLSEGDWRFAPVDGDEVILDEAEGSGDLDKALDQAKRILCS
jgi:hypothetical protein